MSLPDRHLYEFREFRLDTKEKTLMRGEEHLELTPKCFELLTFLVENSGRLLTKDEIMTEVWRDSFVEEGNLTFNIRQLRVILGDNTQQPLFIKTVRHHGYRFIAPINEISPEPAVRTAEDFSPQAAGDVSKIVSETTQRSFTEHISKPNFAVVGLLILVLAGLAAGLLLYLGNRRPSAPILSAPFKLEKISASGKVNHSIITPDGKKVIYTNGRDSEKESIWLRQLEDGSNTNIIPPSDDLYTGLAISPDGETLYFARRARFSTEPAGIYRVSIFGGIPTRIISQTEGWMSLSPDGARLSFVRSVNRPDESSSLMMADAADGKNEKQLDTCQRPFRIRDNQISPDGKRIAFAVGQSENGANEFGLTELNLENGERRELLKEKFFNIKNLAWLPDQSGLLITARKGAESNYRIIHVSSVTGETVTLTKDAETYDELSLDKEATKLISTQVKQDFNLRLINADSPAESRFLTNATTVAFDPSGKIYFSSFMSGNLELWSVNADGSNQRQLTNNPADDAAPVISADGNLIFFTSNRTGAFQVWRMSADGSNQTQITDKEGGFPLFVSPDGEWLYYNHGVSRTLWRISLKSGEDIQILDKPRDFFSLSPDGKQVAYEDKQGDETVIRIHSLADGKIIKTFSLEDGKNFLLQIAWMPDGQKLTYITTTSEFQNNVLWMQSLNEAVPRKIIELGDEDLESFAIYAGKTFAIVQGKWLHDAVLLKGLK